MSQTIQKTSLEDDEDSDDENESEPLIDMEDIGNVMNKTKSKKVKKPRVNKRGVGIQSNSLALESDDKVIIINLFHLMENRDEQDPESDDDDAEEEKIKKGEMAPREMLTNTLRRDLTKQGYRSNDHFVLLRITI